MTTETYDLGNLDTLMTSDAVIEYLEINRETLKYWVRKELLKPAPLGMTMAWRIKNEVKSGPGRPQNMFLRDDVEILKDMQNIGMIYESTMYKAVKMIITEEPTVDHNGEYWMAAIIKGARDRSPWNVRLPKHFTAGHNRWFKVGIVCTVYGIASIKDQWMFARDFWLDARSLYEYTMKQAGLSDPPVTLSEIETAQEEE